MSTICQPPFYYRSPLLYGFRQEEGYFGAEADMQFKLFWRNADQYEFSGHFAAQLGKAEQFAEAHLVG